jgi:hypothetical protein
LNQKPRWETDGAFFLRSPLGGGGVASAV